GGFCIVTIRRLNLQIVDWPGGFCIVTIRRLNLQIVDWPCVQSGCPSSLISETLAARYGSHFVYGDMERVCVQDRVMRVENLRRSSSSNLVLWLAPHANRPSAMTGILRQSQNFHRQKFHSPGALGGAPC
ncbi:hypothetical protein HAX54_014989, partial [Datura stramonium]|nr:hypothetical protein [Datura stramonium]